MGQWSLVIVTPDLLRKRNTHRLKNEKKKKIRWVPLCISGAAVVAGVTIAIVGNIKAKDAYKAGFNNTYEYKRNKNEANVNQSMRNVGIALAITGAIGMGVSILF